MSDLTPSADPPALVSVSDHEPACASRSEAEPGQGCDCAWGGLKPITVNEYIGLRCIPRRRQETSRYIARLNGGADVRLPLPEWDRHHGVTGG